MALRLEEIVIKVAKKKSLKEPLVHSLIRKQTWEFHRQCISFSFLALYKSHLCAGGDEAADSASFSETIASTLSFNLIRGAMSDGRAINFSGRVTSPK
jgi:hypothetical protein